MAIENKRINNPKYIEAIQTIQTNIALNNKELKKIAVTSTVDGEKKGRLLVDLAYLYGEKGHKVCVVDLDLKLPKLQEYYSVENVKGVAEFVEDKETKVSDITTKINENINFISTGKNISMSSKLLESNRIEQLLEALDEHYDYVLVNTTSCLESSDTLLVSKYVDGYLYVCSEAVTKKKDCVKATDTLKRHNVNVLGIVMMDAKETLKY